MKTLQIGDIVYIPGGYRTHGASFAVTKINRKSIKGVEVQGSYRPGTEWSLSVGYEQHVTRETRQEVAPFVIQEWFLLGENGAML